MKGLGTSKLRLRGSSFVRPRLPLLPPSLPKSRPSLRVAAMIALRPAALSFRFFGAAGLAALLPCAFGQRHSWCVLPGPRHLVQLLDGLAPAARVGLEYR
jgi:hypothetical protein